MRRYGGSWVTSRCQRRSIITRAPRRRLRSGTSMRSSWAFATPSAGVLHMSDPKKDPRRRCMPVAKWPPADEDAWRKAMQVGVPFDGCGPAAHWREDTKRKVISAYGRWLTFLQFRGALDWDADP